MSTHLADRVLDFDPAMITMFKEIPRPTMHDESKLLAQAMADENQAKGLEQQRSNTEHVLAPRAVNRTLPERLTGSLIAVKG